MKISIISDFKNVDYEGGVKLTKKIVNYFKKENILSINKLNGDFDIINLHYSGFFPAIKYKGNFEKSIYSLNSNIVPNYFKSLYDVIQGIKYKESKTLYKKIKTNLFYILSQFTPLIFKKYFFKKFKYLVLPSKWLKNKINVKNSLIIYQGIDSSKYKPQKLKKHKKINIRYFGHLSYAKGLLEVIKSMSKIESVLFSKEIFLTESSKKFSSYVAKMDPDIQIYPPVKDIVKEYNLADIIVLPYRHTGAAIATPFVLLEAMSCEKLIITTNLPNIKEICGNSVIYVNPYKPLEIRAAIKYFADRPELRKEYGIRARSRILKYYEEKKMFKKYDNLYKKIISY